MKILYFHGFNSAANPENARVLELQALGEVIPMSYDSFGTYAEVKRELFSQFLRIVGKTKEPLVLAGSSLGAFWAAGFSDRYSYPAILMNPVISPYDTLMCAVNQSLTNFVTKEDRVLTIEAWKSYFMMRLVPKDFQGDFMPFVLLDQGDELVNCENTRMQLRGWPMLDFPGGSHQFEHLPEALPRVRGKTGA
jgi:predicted esterase YcpF (UPF0227 family)